jgi:hypothetical protein
VVREACRRRPSVLDDGCRSGNERRVRGVVLSRGHSEDTACHHGSATLAIKGADENCDGVLAVAPFAMTGEAILRWILGYNGRFPRALREFSRPAMCPR